jgi:hypothetical protein
MSSSRTTTAGSSHTLSPSASTARESSLGPRVGASDAAETGPLDRRRWSVGIRNSASRRTACCGCRRSSS